MAESRRGSTRVAFGDVVRLSRERTSDPDADGFGRYVGLEHIDPGDLRIRRWGDVADGTTFTNVFRPGQVLFGKRRAYQRKVAVADFDGVCSGDIYVLEPMDPSVLLPELLPFICQTDAFFDHAVGTSAGSLSPRTNWASLAAFEFDLPSPPSQHEVSHQLHHTSQLVEAHRRLVIDADAVLDALSMQLLAGALDGANSSQFSEICSKPPHGGIYKEAESRGHGVPLINMGELFSNDFITSGQAVERISVEEDELRRFGLHEGDLLFGRRSIVLEGAGRCVMVSSLDEPSVFESSLLRATLRSGVADSTFVFEWFRSPMGRREIGRIRSFTTVAGIAGSDLSKVVVPVPSLDIQSAIAAQLTDVRHRIGTIRARFQAATRVHQAAIAAVVLT